jgi:hypothetical protein
MPSDLSDRILDYVGIAGPIHAADVVSRMVWEEWGDGQEVLSAINELWRAGQLSRDDDDRMELP